jgi:Fic family protein
MMELNALLSRIDRLKAKIDKKRPLSESELKQLNDYFKVGVTYSSNAIEGNSLTETETKVLLEDGITVGGKPLRDIYEATGHGDAYDFMLSASQNKKLAITETLILRLHELFYQRLDSGNAGCYRNVRVIITGTDYLPPNYDKVPSLMTAFVKELNARKGKTHPVLLAAYAHRRLVDIHPFVDGNGRTARLLMNLILINSGYFVASIPPILRTEYLDALRVAQRKENASDTLFNTLIAECEFETQKDYCRMFGIPIQDKSGREER